VGFLVPSLVLAGWYGVERRAGAIRRLVAPRNLLVFLAIVLPWFLGVSYWHPDFPYYGVVHESLQRYTTTTFHRQPVYFYGFVLAVLFLPWSLLFPESGLLAWRLRGRLTRLDRLCVTWVVVVVVFFSLSRSKLPHYILSVAFPVGILTARLFDSALRQGPQSPSARAVQRVVVLVAVVAAAAGAAAVALAVRPALLSGLERRWPVLGDPAFPAPLAIAAALASIGGLALASAWWREPRLALIGLLAIPLAAIALGPPLWVRLAEPSSSRTLAQRIRALGPEVEVACLACYPTALPFYLGHPITVITRHGLELASNYLTFSLARGAPWPDTLVRRDDLGSWLERKDHPVLILARERSSGKLAPAVGARDAEVERYPGRFVGVVLRPGGGD
jgi:4-amino-4-deoxy-L-arabinose transferase-like glycosyltransferase